MEIAHGTGVIDPRVAKCVEYIKSDYRTTMDDLSKLVSVSPVDYGTFL